MNRDALLASLIGFGIGLLITGILLVGPSLIKGFPQVHLPKLALQSPQKSKTTPTPTPQPATFAITTPAPESVVTSTDLVVSGTALMGSTIVVAGPNDEDVVIIKEDGKFAGKITLIEGKNDITVTQYIQGKGTVLTTTVFYTKENW